MNNKPRQFILNYRLMAARTCPYCKQIIKVRLHPLGTFYIHKDATTGQECEGSGMRAVDVSTR